MYVAFLATTPTCFALFITFSAGLRLTMNLYIIIVCNNEALLILYSTARYDLHHPAHI